MTSAPVAVSHAPAPTHKLAWDILEGPDGLTLTHSQDIPPSWSDWLAEEKRRSWENRNKTEMIRVASVPAIFIHQWLLEGFNAYLEPIPEVVKRLQRQDLTAFVATEKQAF